MSSYSYTIRNYHPPDFEGYAHLKIRGKTPLQSVNLASLESVRERLERPNFSPSQDLFLVETKGEVVAYLEVTPELGIGRVILDCLVAYKHRRKGLASRLTEHAMNRALELGVKAAHANIFEENEIAANLLSKLGFQPVRRFLELQLDFTDIDSPAISGAASSCQHLKHGEEGKLTRIQNRSFAGSWGYNPNTSEDITYYLGLTNCCPENVLLLCEDGEPVGYCWTLIEPGENKGRIHMLGVNPDHRRRGIGRIALLAGLGYLKSKHLGIAEVTVDSENTAARALYQSMGFEIQNASLWYEKLLYNEAN